MLFIESKFYFFVFEIFNVVHTPILNVDISIHSWNFKITKLFSKNRYFVPVSNSVLIEPIINKQFALTSYFMTIMSRMPSFIIVTISFFIPKKAFKMNQHLFCQL